MIFQKYPSIENTYNTKYLLYIKEQNLDGGIWVVQEKIHGANFSFWTDGKEVKCAKRSGFIGDNESFFNYQDVLLKYNDKIIRVFNELNEYLAEDIKELVIFGELFGGNYNHKDVFNSNHKVIQREVQYCPDNEFIAFDIMVNGKFADHVSFFGICAKYGIYQVPAIFYGYLEDCLKISNSFNSIIPALFNLPPLENNICEGIVIKPIIPVYLKSGERVILKNKNEIFSERKSEKKEKPAIGEYTLNMFNELSLLTNKNRVISTISKLGEVTIKDFGTIISETIKDIFDEYNKENENKLNDIDSNDSKVVRKMLNKMLVPIVKEVIYQ